MKTYSECSPAVDQTSIGSNECSTVTSNELGEFSAFWEVVSIDSPRFGFRWVQAFTIIIGIAVRITSVGNVLHLPLLWSLTAQSTLIIDTPSQDLVVMGKSSTVHAADCELNDANRLGREQVIETRAFDIDWLLSAVVLAGSQS